MKKKKKLAIWQNNVPEYPVDIDYVEGDMQGAVGKSTYTSFTVRKSKPTAADKFVKCYKTVSSGGWNGAIVGSPTDGVCDVLSNCVG